MEDAGVHTLDGDTVLVQTVDYITPVLDDPYSFGQAAAANALSDIYAMGARPVTAMNLVGFPAHLGLDVLAEVLRGGRDKVAEAGATLLGGHSVVDAEPKYGLAVTGLARQSELFLQSAARPGDVLFLTKPIGGGLLTAALSREGLPPEALAELTLVLTTLNSYGRDAAVEVGARAATDVTGFGFLGHLSNLVLASGTGAEIDAGSVPVIPWARELARRGPEVFPGGARRNLDFVAGRTHLELPSPRGGSDPVLPLLLADPMTSGGLLVAVPPSSAGAFTDLVAEALAKQDAGAASWCSRVGRLTAETATIRVMV